MTFPALRSGALALFVALLAGCGGGGPADTAEAFQRHVAAGETEAAVELLDPAITQMMGPKIQAAMAAQTAEISAKGGISSVRVLNETINGETATVEMETTYGNGETDSETVTLRQVDGDWKLSPDK